ncbi:MAG: 50S ribosomal protein L33 [Candidatus Nealsonbacteria bacterium CG02_land_8_20_14_3_00_37_10]|uniref:Large ribosomal subunit protein bL33 n=1 Tax=Candidatus Nealsonbacteria bacterium CG02_land_8_20_14_3_00_37_10 TaxID=1974699 RepID=A0A2M7D9R3_9BACT|nr:MAG: 50S ribosomal protein L33 [Candidatus Nealsonbacteria bacterium CG02_land_8_20_14_3_00_37_10]
MLFKDYPCIELKKFCNWCRKNTIHKETKR